MSGKFFSHPPAVLEPILRSGILLAAVVAALLSLVYNGWNAAQETVGAR